VIGDILLYAGSALITVWGIAHIVPTKSVVNGFGAISQENKRIITMEWIAEGLTLCFIGLLVLFVTIFKESQNQVSNIVYWASAAMLLVMAVLTSLTGARTSIVPIKICPAVKIAVAILFVLGSLL
jgi:chromate transport protein ChrA